MTTTVQDLNPQSTLQEVLDACPGAQRTLFQRYHIGGCRSCGFSPTETLAGLAERNGGLDVFEMLDHIRSCHEQEEKRWLAPAELARLRDANPALRLLDIRTREEFEAARLEGAVLFSQPLLQEMLGHWPKYECIVVIDHDGQQALDAAAFFLGHGFENVRALRGGIDAWSREVDPRVPRYRLE